MGPSEAEAKSKIAALAAAMSAGDLSLLEGCRRIVALRPGLSPATLADPDLQALVAIEPDLEDRPTRPARNPWDSEVLTEKERKVAAYLARSNDQLLEACGRLAVKWK